MVTEGDARYARDNLSPNFNERNSCDEAKRTESIRSESAVARATQNTVIGIGPQISFQRSSGVTA